MLKFSLLKVIPVLNFRPKILNQKYVKITTIWHALDSRADKKNDWSVVDLIFFFLALIHRFFISIETMIDWYTWILKYCLYPSIETNTKIYLLLETKCIFNPLWWCKLRINYNKELTEITVIISIHLIKPERKQQ